MSATVEKLETNKVKLTFSVSPERFEEGLQYAYNKNKGRIAIPGFRKGKAPRKLIEVQYGPEFFYEDAVNYVFPDALKIALKENDLESVSRPVVDFDNISKEEGVTFTAELFIKPEVEISGYKGITYETSSIEVTEEEIDAEVNKAREQNARIVSISDRSLKTGDIAVIDYEGFIDGEAFDGGKGTDRELTLGSHSFIDTFEEQLEGKNIGDDVEVNVTFPEKYHSEDLAGKKALFKVQVKDIKEKILPEADDDFAQDVSEFDTLVEYRQSIKEKLEANKKSQAERDKEDQIMKALIEKVNTEIPEAMIENQTESLLNNYKNRIMSSGMDFQMYLQYVGQTEQQVLESFKPNAEDQVKGRLALESIANQENIEVSQDDLNGELDKIASAYGMDRDMIQKVIGEEEQEEIKRDIKVQKALEFILEQAVATDKKED